MQSLDSLMEKLTKCGLFHAKKVSIAENVSNSTCNTCRNYEIELHPSVPIPGSPRISKDPANPRFVRLVGPLSLENLRALPLRRGNLRSTGIGTFEVPLRALVCGKLPDVVNQII